MHLNLRATWSVLPTHCICFALAYFDLAHHHTTNHFMEFTVCKCVGVCMHGWHASKAPGTIGQTPGKTLGLEIKNTVVSQPSRLKTDTKAMRASLMTCPRTWPAHCVASIHEWCQQHLPTGAHQCFDVHVGTGIGPDDDRRALVCG